MTLTAVCFRCLAVACTFASTACASTRFNQHFEAQRWSDAALEFSADSATIRRDERSLFRAAQLFGSPGSSAFDPDRARALFEEFVQRYPGSDRVPSALSFIALLDETQRIRNEAILRERELRNQIRTLTHEIQRLEDRIGWFESRFVAQEEQNATLRRIADRLETNLRDRESQLRTLQEELDRLKDIDLGSSRSQPPPDRRGRNGRGPGQIP